MSEVVFWDNLIFLEATRTYEKLMKGKEENKELRRQNDLLQEEIISLKSDPYAIEKIAREKLNLAKSGDQVYRIVSTQN